MAGIQPSDAAPKSPGDKIGDPLAPLSTQMDELGAVLQMVFEDPQEWVTDLIDDVLELPPEERFTNSVEVFEEHVREDFGGIDTLQSLMPSLNTKRALSFLRRLLDRLIEDTIEGIWYDRNGEPYLIVSAGYTALLHGINGLNKNNDDKARVVLSSWLAYFARLYSIESDNGPTEEDRAKLVRDVGRLIYYIERAVDGEASFVDDPESVDEEVLRARIREFGAVLAYSRLNISVGRGAELAGVSKPVFEDLLDQYGIAPRYGPDSVEELYAELDGHDD